MQEGRFDLQEFKGDYQNLVHLVRDRRFDAAAAALLDGWRIERTEHLTSSTEKILAAIFMDLTATERTAGSSAEDIAEEVLVEVEIWLESLLASRKAKRIQ